MVLNFASLRGLDNSGGLLRGGEANLRDLVQFCLVNALVATINKHNHNHVNAL